LNRELADHRSAARAFEGAAEDPLVYMKQLVAASEQLRMRYLGVHSWFVVGTKKECQAFEQSHNYSCEHVPVRLLLVCFSFTDVVARWKLSILTSCGRCCTVKLLLRVICDTSMGLSHVITCIQRDNVRNAPP
jgi:hypothetical protein